MGFDVKDKVALVTGANRGIGKAITESLLSHGAAKVYAAVRDTDSVKPLIDAHGGDRVVAVKLDLTEPDTITAAAKVAHDATLVINNAGVLRTATPLDPDAARHLRFEIDVNVVGLMLVAQAFEPVLTGNGGGAFVQLNSVASYKNFEQFATYSASKAAAYSITQALRALWKDKAIQVLSVHPGPIDTDMAQNAGLGEIAEPPSLVGETIVSALGNGDFHAYPDSMAKQVGAAYASFAENIIEAEMAEA